MAEQGGTPGPTSRTRIVAAVVVSILVTAAAAGGVGAVAELSDPDSSVVEELTTSTPDETAQFPPGTNESGVTNATALLAAHHDALQNTSYSAEVTATDSAFATDAAPNATDQEAGSGDPSAGSFDATVERGDAGTNTSIAAQGNRGQYWVTENATATRTVHTENNVTTAMYQYTENGLRTSPGDGETQEVRPVSTIAPYLSALDYSHQETVTRGNDTLHRFVATGVDERADGAAADRLLADAENASSKLLVDERGVVHQFGLRFESERGNESVTTRVNLSVGGIGETTTSEPPWVSEQLPQFEASILDNGRVLALQYVGVHAGSNGTQSPTGVFVSSPNVQSHASVTTPLSPGDTVYLWRTNESGGLASSVDDPPSVNESFVAFGGERVALSTSRYDITAPGANASESSTTVELSVSNETANAST